MGKGIDCSTPLTATTARKLFAAGYIFVARYLVPINFAWKRLTRKEAEIITDAGMQIVSVFEAGANRARGGATAGAKDGVSALLEAQAVGQPKGSAIYFAVDYDAPESEYDAIEEYLRAAAVQIPVYDVGVYGSYSVCKAMYERGAVRKVWQTYAWSRGIRFAHMNIYQHQNDIAKAGITVDLNESYGDEGWWNTKEDEAMTADEKKAFCELQEQVAALTKLYEASEKRQKQHAPKWFIDEFKSADLGGIIKEPVGSEDFWRTIAVILRAAKAGKLQN